MNESILKLAIKACNENSISFTKFITANDAGTTGAHQSGFHLHKNSWPLFFSTAGTKGKNKDSFVKIIWQDDFETDSRFIYYGIGTRNEYRLTRFGRGFPFLNDENVGNLLIISKKEDNYYQAFVLSKDLDIEAFFDAFGISSTETNSILPKSAQPTSEEIIKKLIAEFISQLKVDFPPSRLVADGARDIFSTAYQRTNKQILSSLDQELINWINTEFNLFKEIEYDRYNPYIVKPILSVDNLINIANSILNRRKSRAGKSLEHHLSAAFDISKIQYTPQAKTEGNKKPDFIFPNEGIYLNEQAGSEKLTFLGAKTTCKDRWRQIINEADKIPNKHLFTLQQGISSNQLKEMKQSNITLVVPKPYVKSFPKEHRSDILDLDSFVKLVRSRQNLL